LNIERGTTAATQPATRSPAPRYFAQLAGGGLDARAIELVNWRLKKRVGPLAYVWAGLKALMERKPTITVHGGAGELQGELVLIGNGRLYAGDFATVPAAQLDDGRLDVCVLPRVSFFVLLQCALPLLWSKRLPESLVRRVQTERFTLTAAEPVAYELDGELAGRLPVTFSVARRALRVVVP
jgi:diacylglycerol kinase (ATP)